MNENTRNNGFTMISNWYIYFCAYLDRENQYILKTSVIECSTFRDIANGLQHLGERLQSRGPEQAGHGSITTRSASPYSNEEWWHFLVNFFGSEVAIIESLRVNREAFEDALAYVTAFVPSVRGLMGRIISIKQQFYLVFILNK